MNNRSYIRTLCQAALLALGTASGMAQINLTNGLVGYYPFDGDATDHSGRGHDAQLTGAGFASDRFDRTNAALDLRGPNNWGKIPHHADFLIGTNDFTWSVWLKYGPQASNGYPYSAVLIKARISAPWDGPTTFVDLTPGRFTYRLEGTSERTSSTTGLNDNTWRHFAFVRSNLTLRLYIGGVLDSSLTLTSLANLNTTEPTWIGANQVSQTSQNYAGLLDELCIYNRALSEAEIQALASNLVIVQQPKSFIGVEGTSGSFSVSAVGNPPLSYQWYKNGTLLTDATNMSFVFPQIRFTDEGNYTVVVFSGSDSATSEPASLVVNPAGVSIALYAGVTVEGVVGRTYQIQYTTDLSNTNSWQVATNLTLQTSPQLWVDISTPAINKRYYRVKVVVP